LLAPAGWSVPLLNLLSAAGMAAAVGLVTALTGALTGSLTAAVGAGLLLGFSHLPWWLATVAEVSSWSLAGMALEWLLFVRLWQRPDVRGLARLAAVNGLGFSLHNAALLNLPVYAASAVVLTVRRQLPLRAFAAAGVCWLTGAAPLLALAAEEAISSGSASAALSSVLFGRGFAPQVLGSAGVSGRLAVANLALMALSYANPVWLLAMIALFRRRVALAPGIRWSLAALLALHAAFLLRYFVPDQALFALPTLGLAAVWAGVGLAGLMPRLGRRGRAGLLAACLLGGAAVCWIAGQVARDAAWFPTRARKLPFRDEARYWLWPWKQAEDSAARFAAAALKQAGRHAVVCADTTSAAPLLAMCAAAGRDEPVICSAYDGWSQDTTALRRFLRATFRQGRPVYVVTPAPGYAPPALLSGGYRFEPQGVLYRVFEENPEP
jgi:hypothetical protein